MGTMGIEFGPQGIWLAGGGMLVGLWLLARGLSGYRTATRLGDTSTSTIASLAAGEVRISGTIDLAESSLVSPLQSRRCVYYDATIGSQNDIGDIGATFEEERAVGFNVRDRSGTIRVFPRGARWDVPVRFDASTGTFGDEPAGLDRRTGSAYGSTDADREAAIEALLTVKGVDGPHPSLFERTGFGVGQGRNLGRNQGRRYREARLEPGDAVTIVGRALPFSDLADPADADRADGTVRADDLEVAMDLAEARAAGLLADTAAEAWGNAAIPGFGIGRPSRLPEIDASASAPTLATAAETDEAKRRFTIEPHALVLAHTTGVPLLIAHGAPGTAVDRHHDRFVGGLLGAVLAIGSAMALAILIAGGSVR
jgi:hypothetical protein